jgi:predicted nucleotidyltransferase
MTPQVLLHRVVADLVESGFDFALVGALAVGVRGVERTTKDIDLAVAASSTEQAMVLLRHLIEKRSYRLLSAPDFHKDLPMRPMVSVTPPEDPGFCVDLLFHLCGIESEVVARAEMLELLPGVLVKVATRADLIAMKTLSFDDQRRIHDMSDLKGLLEAASDRDVAAARSALELMERRGIGKVYAKDNGASGIRVGGGH